MTTPDEERALREGLEAWKNQRQIERDRSDVKYSERQAQLGRVTYTRESGHSFFADAAAAALGSNDPGVNARLRDHRIEQRISGLTTSSVFGSVPLWAEDQFVISAKALRPTADSAVNLALPKGHSTIVLPQISSGASATVQTQLGSVSDASSTYSDATTSVNVKGVVGQLTLSRQLQDLAAPEWDGVVSSELAAALGAEVEATVLSTISGWSGVISMPTSVTTPIGFLSSVAAAQQDIWQSRLRVADLLIVSPGVWAWLTSTEDTAGRAWVLPADKTVVPRVASSSVVGTVQGLTVIVSPLAGTTAYVLVSKDLLLWESPITVEVARDTNATTPNFGVIAQAHEYMAAALRYSSSAALISIGSLVQGS